MLGSRGGCALWIYFRTMHRMHVCKCIRCSVCISKSTCVNDETATGFAWPNMENDIASKVGMVETKGADIQAKRRQIEIKIGLNELLFMRKWNLKWQWCWWLLLLYMHFFFSFYFSLVAESCMRMRCEWLGALTQICDLTLEPVLGTLTQWNKFHNSCWNCVDWVLQFNWRFQHFLKSDAKLIEASFSLPPELNGYCALMKSLNRLHSFPSF